jgi:hypothetical protein
VGLTCATPVILVRHPARVTHGCAEVLLAERWALIVALPTVKRSAACCFTLAAILTYHLVDIRDFRFRVVVRVAHLFNVPDDAALRRL